MESSIGSFVYFGKFPFDPRVSFAFQPVVPKISGKWKTPMKTENLVNSDVNRPSFSNVFIVYVWMTRLRAVLLFPSDHARKATGRRSLDPSRATELRKRKRLLAKATGNNGK